MQFEQTTFCQNYMKESPESFWEKDEEKMITDFVNV